jgi:cytoskeletal protein CcmA (bactofilin family)
MSTTLGRTIAVKGEVRTTEDLTVAGRVDGPIYVDKSVLVIEATAAVAGDLIADDITVFGRVHGQLVAADIVDLRAGSAVRGQVVAKRFMLDPDAEFNGRVEPQHLAAALSVAKYQQKKRDAV